MGTLVGWRYCPRCAAPLVHDEGRVACDACGFVYYAGSAPAVAALVLDESGNVLLGRRAVEPDAGLWDALGGFLDEGEDPIAGLHRELAEEAGVEIEVGRYVGAFVDRYGDDADATSVLNLVWEARITEGDPAPADDVSEVRWFALDALPAEGELAFRWLARCLDAWAADHASPSNAEGPANRAFD